MAVARRALRIAGWLAAVTPGLAQAADRPNFVVVLVDDAALMDFGAYGGEARTPTIDALARRGTMFTRYRTSPSCATTRAMLLTGVDNHRAGVGTIPEYLAPELAEHPSYRMSLAPGVLTVAARLKTQGYRTSMVGKWHLGHGVGELPDAHGFDRSFVLDAAGADNWEDKPFMPYYPEAHWFEDGREAALPDDFYSSEFLVDRAIDYLSEAPTGDPFFAYLAFLAIHVPVQAPAAFTANYDGVFDGGWDRMRDVRWRRAQELGLIVEHAPPPVFHEGLRSWDALDASERRLYARRMQVNAGMIEAMDHHLGRLVAHLAASGELDRTVFLIASDNGPEFADAGAGAGLWMWLNDYRAGLEGIGERGSFGFIGAEWASAAASPSRLYKAYASEGGLRSPLIVSGPGIRAGARVDAAAFVTDLAPTVLELAGAPARIDGAVEMDGRSLMPVIRGDADRVHGADDAYGFELSGNSALYRGDYKITRNQPPVGDGRWRLFHIAADPGETRDLSALQPELMREMLQAYAAYEARAGVLPIPPGYNHTRQLAINTLTRLWQRHWLAVVIVLLAVAAAVGLGAASLLRRRRH